MSAPDSSPQSSNSTFPPYSTRALPTGAALKSLGYPCVVTLVGPAACCFNFPGSPEIYAAAAKIERNEAMVSPLAYNTAKAELHDEVNALLKRQGVRGGR